MLRDERCRLERGSLSTLNTLNKSHLSSSNRSADLQAVLAQPRRLPPLPSMARSSLSAPLRARHLVKAFASRASRCPAIPLLPSWPQPSRRSSPTLLLPHRLLLYCLPFSIPVGLPLLRRHKSTRRKKDFSSADSRQVRARRMATRSDLVSVGLAQMRRLSRLTRNHALNRRLPPSTTLPRLRSSAHRIAPARVGVATSARASLLFDALPLPPLHLRPFPLPPTCPTALCRFHSLVDPT